MYVVFLIVSLSAGQLDWTEYYPTSVVKDISGLEVETELKINLPAGYVLHRIDMEKVFVMDKELDECEKQLSERQEDPPLPPSFWDSYVGKMTIGGVGFLGGAALVLLVVGLT